MGTEFRELTNRERGLLEKLVETAAHGRVELRTQLNRIKAKQIEEDGTLQLRCISGSPSKYTPVSEGLSKDADGSDIAVILHSDKDGFLCMLEIIKYDGSRIITPPSAETLTLNTVAKFQVREEGDSRRTRDSNEHT